MGQIFTVWKSFTKYASDSEKKFGDPRWRQNCVVNLGGFFGFPNVSMAVSIHTWGTPGFYGYGKKIIPDLGSVFLLGQMKKTNCDDFTFSWFFFAFVLPPSILVFPDLFGLSIRVDKQFLYNHFMVTTICWEAPYFCLGVCSETWVAGRQLILTFHPGWIAYIEEILPTCQDKAYACSHALQTKVHALWMIYCILICNIFNKENKEV